MGDDFPASTLVIGSQECRYDKIAEVINNSKGSPFREYWKRFAWKIEVHNDYILLLEQKVSSEGIESTIIKLLEKWSDKGKAVTLSQLTRVLKELELNSKAQALQDHFNASIVSKTAESPNDASGSTSSIFNRTTKTVFRNKKATPIHIAKHLFKPALENNPTESTKALLRKRDTNVSLEDENKKRYTTEWLKKRNYIMCLVAVISLIICVVVGLYYISRSQFPSENGKTESKDSTAENITHYIYASTYKEYQKAASQVAPFGNLVVNITTLNLINWPASPKLSNADCIKTMVVSNITVFSLLFQILHQTTKLESLHIVGSPSSNCSYNESLAIFRKHTIYSSIISIEISNFTSCQPVYEFFSTFFVSRKLLTFSLVQSDIDDTNINHIQLIMQHSANTLQNLTFLGVISSSKFLFSFDRPLLEVKTIRLDIVQRKQLLVSSYDHNIAGENICKTLKNIHTFENTAGINLLDFYYVLKCTQLQNLTARVIISSGGPFFNISSAFKGAYLEYVNLSLQFDLPCPWCQKMKLLGMTSLKKRILYKPSIEFINCVCQDESSERGEKKFITYLLEQRDHSNKKSRHNQP